MIIQFLPNIFKKIGLLLFLISISIPMITGFLNPCVSNEEFSLLYPYDTLFEITFLVGIILFFISKRKGKSILLTQ